MGTSASRAKRSARQTSRRVRLGAGDAFWGGLFVSPQLIGLLAFTLFPVLMSLYLCFTSWNFIDPPEFVGLRNLTAVFGNTEFYTSLFNTFFLVAGIVPLTTVSSLLLALLTTLVVSNLEFYRSAFFLPLITPTVAIAMVWYWLYAPDFGLINAALGLVGIPGPPWLTHPAWAKPAVILMISWQSMGWYYLLFLAGLKNIPREYYEASSIDGAGPVSQFFSITLPLLSPTTFFVLTTMLISAFNIFNEVFIMTRGGPIYSTHTIVMEIYDLAFRYFRMGEAAVVSWVLFIILFVLTLIQFRLSRRWVHYGS
jgi:multiple sugar transport system permease protein